jgi:lipopolysaccharide export system permease protein
MNPSRIDRYVFRQLLGALLAVTLGLVALIWLTQSLRFVELVVNRGLSFAVFLKLTGLLIPGFVAVILPITCFVVVLFVYQRLNGDRELTVMRAAGLSPLALARPALGLSALVILSCYVLNIYIVPASAVAFRTFHFEIRNRIAAFLLQEGVFTTISNDLVVYIRARDRDGTLRGILVDDARDPAHRATILAETGRLLEGANGPRVLLQSGSRQELDNQTGRLNVLTFRENTVDLSQPGKGDEQRLRDVGEMSVSELLDPDPATVNPRDIPKMRVEAHKRLATPLTAGSFALVALAAMLTGMFQRHAGMLRPMAAIAAVVGLVALGLALDSMAVRHNELIPLIWIRAALPGVLVAGWLFLPLLGSAGVGDLARAARAVR